MDTIKTFADLVSARKNKEKAIEKIKNDFEVSKTISQSLITSDLLSSILLKLTQIKEQKQNEEILELEQNYKNGLSENEIKLKKLSNEVEDILATITSSISRNKRVEKITETNIQGKDEEYIAYLENGVQYKLTLEQDTDLAKRYLEIKEIENALFEIDKNASKEHREEMKKISKDYVEWDFGELLQELSLVSKNPFWNVRELNKKDFVNFYGSKNDFDNYKGYLENIETTLKEIVEIEKEYKNQHEINI